MEKQAPPNFKIVSMRYVLQSGFICLISSFESKNIVRRKKIFKKISRNFLRVRVVKRQLVPTYLIGKLGPERNLPVSYVWNLTYFFEDFHITFLP